MPGYKERLGGEELSYISKIVSDYESQEKSNNLINFISNKGKYLVATGTSFYKYLVDVLLAKIFFSK